MKRAVFAIACTGLTGFAAQAQADSPVEVRFCPATPIRAYPLDADARMHSILVQGFAVINHGAKPVEVGDIHLELLNQGQVVDSRTLGAALVKRWGDSGPPIQATMKIAPFQYCGTDMIAPDVTLAGPVLKQNQALIVLRQVFAYDQARDALRIRVDSITAGGPMLASATIPISTAFSRTAYIFPLRGISYVGWGASFHTGHRYTPAEEFALDIAKLGGDGISHRGSGSKFEDYYAYGTDVLAAADGTVVTAVNDQPEDASSMQQPGESDKAYYTRVQEVQAKLLAKGTDVIAGNFIMIDHGNGEYSLYAHMQPGSVLVHKGDRVKAGTVIGKLGSSGNSTEPHLHFHVCDHPDPLACAGVPVNFSNITILWADGPRALQSGDIVTAN